MALVLNTNVVSLNAQRNLSASQGTLAKSLIASRGMVYES